MKKTFFRFVVASCALGLLPATLQAQVRQPEPAERASQQPERESGAQRPVPAGEQREGENPFEARRIDPSASPQQAQTTVQGYLVTQLMLANKAEIELSQVATEKAQSPEVKQYAQKMVQAHQRLNEQLQQLQSGSSTPGGSALDKPDLGQGQARGDSPLRGQTERPAREGNAAAERPRLSEGTQPTRSTVAAHGGQNVPQELTRISRQAAENHLQMSKQMLQRFEGQNFDMGFLSMQIVGHTAMLAGLQAIQDAGSPEFQQLVKQAEQATSEHLDEAKQLAKKLEDKERGEVSENRQPNRQPVRRPGSTDNRRSN